jgi:hypothetical protein
MEANEMAIRRTLALGLLGVMAGACSYGTITDAQTKQSLGGAKLRSETMSLTSAATAPVQVSSLRTAQAWSSSMPGSNGANGSWYLNPYATLNADDTKNLLIPAGWTRFEVSQPGYDTRRFFRNHQYKPCTVPVDNPYSAGSYAYNTNSDVTDGQCAPQSFALQPSNVNYPKDPDMIVDPRWLRDFVVSTTRGTPVAAADYTFAGNTCEGVADSCVRVSVGTANVGAGDLYVTAPEGQQNNVTQHRFNRNSGVTDTVLSASFVSDGHPHLHLANWTQIRLRAIDNTCNTQATASNCPVLPATGRKVSFCLLDSLVFDTSNDAATYASNRGYNGCDIVENGLITQGIGAGRMDVYGWGLVGQMVPADGLHGKFWLEVEVNPADAQGRRTVIESDYTNNVSRIVITLP